MMDFKAYNRFLVVSIMKMAILSTQLSKVPGLNPPFAFSGHYYPIRILFELILVERDFVASVLESSHELLLLLFIKNMQMQVRSYITVKR